MPGWKDLERILNMDEGQMVRTKAPANPVPGMRVTRMIGGEMPVEMVVCAVTDKLIGCWPVEPDGTIVRILYRFDRRTGGEIDKGLGWSAFETGSYIVEKPVAEQQDGVDVPGREEVPCRKAQSEGEGPCQGQGER
jgi:hypothetical protein